MTAYDKNMIALKEVHPDLHKWLSDQPDVDWLRIDGDQLWIRSADTDQQIPVYNIGDPLGDVKDIDKISKTHRQNVTIILGLGLGHAANQVLSTMEKGHHMVIVEPVGHMIRAAFIRYDFSEHIRSRFLLFAPRQEEIDFSLIYLDNVKVVEDWGVLVDRTCRERPEYRRVMQHLVTSINQMQCNTGTVVSSGAKIADNDIASLPYVIRHRGIAELVDLFKGKPAVIVGTGPSLARNIHILREYQDNVIVIAVAQALRPLLAYDIRPDFICTVDFGEVNMTHLAGLMDSDVPMVTINKAYAPMLKAYRGPKFISASVNSGFENTSHGILNERGCLAQGGSVAHMAFSLAVNMGCEPIAFMGIDLALGETSHSPLADSAGRIEVIDGQIRWQVDDPRSKTLYGQQLGMGTAVYVHGWWGQPVLTNTGLLSFIKAMENLIDSYDVVTYDCTEGGARKKGTYRRLLSDFMEKYCKQPVDKTVISPLLSLDPEADVLIAKLMPMLDNDIKNLDAIIENTHAALLAAWKARNTDKPEKLVKIFKQNEKYSLAAQEAAKKLPTVMTAIYGASRRIGCRNFEAEGNETKLLLPEYKKERLIRIERNETILKAARDTAIDLKKTYEEVRNILERYINGEKSVLDPIGETCSPSLYDAEQMLAAGNFAKPLLEAQRIIKAHIPGHPARVDACAIETKALQMRNDKIREAEQLQAETDCDLPHYMDLCDIGHEAGVQKDYEKALQILGKAVKLKPSYQQARWGVASALNMLGRLNDARDYYEQLVKDFPDNPRLRFELGQVLVKLWQDEDGCNKLSRPIELIGTVMRESKEFDHFLLTYAAILKKAERNDEARQSLAEYKRLFPGDPEAEWELL